YSLLFQTVGGMGRRRRASHQEGQREKTPGTNLEHDAHCNGLALIFHQYADARGAHPRVRVLRVPDGSLTKRLPVVARLSSVASSGCPMRAAVARAAQKMPRTNRGMEYLEKDR